MQIHLQIFF